MYTGSFGSLATYSSQGFPLKGKSPGNEVGLTYLVQLLSSFFAQMIRKSVETRDWLNTIEPRNVRAVMKRIVEDVSAIDTQVGQLYEEGVRKAHSSGLSLEEPTVCVD